MTVSRRQFLTGAAVAAAGSAFGLSACGSDGGSVGGSATLQFAWWGNDVRNKYTNKAIAAYTKANPKVSINPQPGDGTAYWDKLATQTAANNAPDIIQMDMSYISEYASRGALLDLSKYGVDTSKFTEGTADAGKIDGQLTGVSAGINTLAIFANPDLFDKAGVELPDDKTWTWDDYLDLAARIQAKGGAGVTGTRGLFGTDYLLQIWLRQNGKDTFASEGLGFTADDLIEYLNLAVEFTKKKATPSAAQISEETTKPLDENQFVLGKQGMTMHWTNQLQSVNDASSKKMTMLRPPTVAGDASTRNAWYKASMLWSASSRTKEPEAVGKFIDWLINSEAAADNLQDERGVPANADVAAHLKPKISAEGKQSLEFVNDVKPELGDNPVAPPPGGGELATVMDRNCTNLLFGRTGVRATANKIVEEMKSALNQ